MDHEWNGDLTKWRNNIKNAILAIVSVLNPGYKDFYVNEENIKIWEKAFTTPLVDEINNYEALEYFGDKILDTSFASILYDVYEGRIEADKLTNIRNGFLSNKKSGSKETLGQQALLFEPLKLFDINLIRLPNTVDTITKKLETDISESFTGALYIISNRIVSDTNDSYGSTICKNLLKYLILKKFNTKTILKKDLERSIIGYNIKTSLIEIFTGYRSYKKYDDGSDQPFLILTGKNSVSFILTEERYKLLKQLSSLHSENRIEFEEAELNLSQREDLLKKLVKGKSFNVKDQNETEEEVKNDNKKFREKILDKDTNFFYFVKNAKDEDDAYEKAGVILNEYEITIETSKILRFHLFLKSSFKNKYELLKDYFYKNDIKYLILVEDQKYSDKDNSLFYIKSVKNDNTNKIVYMKKENKQTFKSSRNEILEKYIENNIKV